MNAYILAALPPALLLIADPTLWPWALAVAAFVALVALSVASHVFRDQRDEARAEADRLERELEARLTDPSTATTQRVPWLRVVRETDDDWFGRLYGDSGELR